MADELKSLFLCDSLSEALAHSGTQKQLTPKRAPWFSGFWEQLIGLTKSSLRTILGRTHATMECLQATIVEIGALLNDWLLTHSFPDIGDPEPITPSHLFHGRRITTLQHITTKDDEIVNHSFEDTSQIRYRERVHAVIVIHFWKIHKTTNNNKQHVNFGDVMLVHDDSARLNWKLAVIELVNKRKYGLICSTDIHTATGRTNHPIAHLYYLLEVTAAEETTRLSSVEISEIKSEECSTPSERPVREAARRGKEQMKQWVTSLYAT